MRKRGYTLVATLFTVAILLMLGMVLLTGGLGGKYSENTGAKARPDGKGDTMPTYMKATAQDQVCRSNLSQVRQAIQIARLSGGDEQAPATIEETRLGESFYQCPLGKEPYQYDSTTGTVQCVHPGHENY